MNKEFNNLLHNGLYVIRDCISDNFSNIFYANSDLHAYEFHKSNLENCQKTNPNLTLDDFELIFIGIQDKKTALITPDYRLVNEETFEAIKAAIKEERAKAVAEIQKSLEKQPFNKK